MTAADPRPIFVAGCGRSGTTFLARMLAGHPRVIAPPESQFFIQSLARVGRSGQDKGIEAFAEAIGTDWRFKLWGLAPGLPVELLGDPEIRTPGRLMVRLVENYAAGQGAPEFDHWVDHTPINLGYAETVLGAYPDSFMVHLVRDPRAVIASVLPLDWGPTTPRAAARWWLTWLGTGLAAEGALPRRVLRVRYEDLITEPEDTLKGLCARIGLPFDPAMTQGGSMEITPYTHRQHARVAAPPDRRRIDAWRTSLSEEDIGKIEGELMGVPAMLGYEPAFDGPRMPSRSTFGEVLRANALAVGQRCRHRLREARALRQPRRGAST